MAIVLLAVIYAAFIGLGIPDSLFGAARRLFIRIWGAMCHWPTFTASSALWPVFPNMTYLTPIHFGQDVCQSLIGLQMTVTYGAFVLAPLLFTVLARTVGVGMFPVVCAVMLGLAVVATALLMRRTGKGRV